MVARPVSPPVAPAPRGPIVVALGFIVLTVLATYHGATRGVFVFDDISNVVENESIRQAWPLTPALSPPAQAGVGGRPFANLTLALDHALSGLAPWSYHTTNVALHLAAALTLFGVVRRTLRRPIFPAPLQTRATPVAAAAAALWAAHPLATSAVSYVSQRTEVLMALCYLLTLYGVIRRAETGARRWTWFALVACALGMASKEVMVTAPIVALLYDRIFLGGSWSRSLRERFGLHLGLIATWYLLARLMAASRLGQRGVGLDLGVSWFDYALTQAGAVLRYLKLSAWPERLVFDYGWLSAPSVATGLLAAAVCLALVAAAGWSLRRAPALGFAGLVVFGLLAPTSSVVPIVQQPVAESRMYLPLAVVVSAGAIALTHALGRRALAPFAALLVALGLGAIDRQHAYRNEVALWSDTAAKQPTSARAHGNLAAALLRAGRAGDAVAAAERALALRPGYFEAEHNLAVALTRTGKLDAAIARFDTLLQQKPDAADTHASFGEALFQAGRSADAIRHLENALALTPGHPFAHNTLSVVLLPLGRVAEAAANARAALMTLPDLAEAHYNLGNALAQLGDRPSAIESFRTALQLQPGFAKAHNNLGGVLRQSGQTAEAVTHFEAALRLDPNYRPARENLERARMK